MLNFIFVINLHQRNWTQSADLCDEANHALKNVIDKFVNTDKGCFVAQTEDQCSKS